MTLFKKCLPATLVVLLGACATMIDGPAQEITINTPGATESRCILDNGLRYVVRGGETIQIQRTPQNITIDCYASGNRQRRMKVDVAANSWTMLNAANGVVPGLAYDHFARGLYEYPDVVTIDFVNEPAKGYDLPDYHNSDGVNPYDQAIESYAPSRLKLRNEENMIQPSLEKRDMSVPTNPFSYYRDQRTLQGGGYVGGTAPVTVNDGSAAGASIPYVSGAPQPIVPQGSTTEELNRSMNPAVFRAQ